MERACDRSQQAHTPARRLVESHRRITVLAKLVIASRKPLVFPIVRYETKVQSRTIDPDGTANIFVVIDSQVTRIFKRCRLSPICILGGFSPTLEMGKSMVSPFTCALGLISW